jgi:hypothetical protein
MKVIGRFLSIGTSFVSIGTSSVAIGPPIDRVGAPIATITTPIDAVDARIDSIEASACWSGVTMAAIETSSRRAKTFARTGDDPDAALGPAITGHCSLRMLVSSQ